MLPGEWKTSGLGDSGIGPELVKALAGRAFIAGAATDVGASFLSRIVRWYLGEPQVVISSVG